MSQLLHEGMGICLMDQLIARTQLTDTLVLRKLEPDVSYVYGLEYQEPLTKNEQIYVRYIQKKLAQ